MNTDVKFYFPPVPPLLVGAALLLWGWQCNFLLYAIIMAILLELSNIFSWRMNITNREFNHISDLSSIIFFIATIYSFFANSFHGIYTILSLLPFLFFLLLLAQVYSEQGYIKPSTLFISLRRIETDQIYKREHAIDLSFPFVFICIISASEGNHHAILFYIFIIILIGWALWCLKPVNTRNSVWLMLLITASASGYGGQIGLQHMQTIAESVFMGWFEQFMWRSRDPNRNSTAIGTLGKLKQSDRIILRVDTHGSLLNQPLLLRETAYTNYSYGVWTNYQNTFHLIDPVPGGNKWILNKSIPETDNLTISFYLDDETAVAPIPAGTESIGNVKVSQLEYSPYGILSIELNEGWIKYDVFYNQKYITDASPTRDDLVIPEPYKDDLKKIVAQLGLDTKTPEEAVDTIKQFFKNNFKYSLTQSERYPKGRYLSKFLFETRKGHCEFFATSTALLLRTAGIPTRYVVGYSVSEYSNLERQYIARARHAHSWVLVYLNGRWENLDTTPSVWATEEEKYSSSIEPLIDLLSYLSYSISRWKSNDKNSGIDFLLWILIPLLAIYIWKMFIANKKIVQKITGERYSLFSARGIDSPFFKIINEIDKLNYPRKSGQTLTNWIDKLDKKSIGVNLKELTKLHYKYRFDPEGLTTNEKNILNEHVNKALENMNQ